MEFIDLKAIHKNSCGKIDEAIDTVLEHGRFINGPEVFQFEEALSEFLDGANCVAVSSGTAALEIALRALGVGPGDEVITTPFSWISTAETIGLVGAIPVFSDIDPVSYNIDPIALQAAITSRTKAIIPVNLFGQMADYDAIERIATKHGLFIIEDAAQSLGAEQKGRKSCTVGTVSCTSFFPAKPLGCYGDGGAVFSADKELAGIMRAIANHGGKTRGEHAYLGTNARCDTLQAAILSAKLPSFRKEISLRQEVGQRYSESFKNYCQIPLIKEGNTHVFAQYTIRPKNRNKLAEALRARNIPTAIYYRKCLHLQSVFKKQFGFEPGMFPHAEKASEEVISLPFHPYLSSEDQNTIIEAVIDCEQS